MVVFVRVGSGKEGGRVAGRPSTAAAASSFASLLKEPGALSSCGVWRRRKFSGR